MFRYWSCEKCESGKKACPSRQNGGKDDCPVWFFKILREGKKALARNPKTLFIGKN